MNEEFDPKEYIEHKEKCSYTFDKMNDSLNKFDRAIYGDKENDKIGMLQMQEEMYKFFTSGKISIRVIKYTFWGLLTILGSIFGIWKLIKELFMGSD